MTICTCMVPATGSMSRWTQSLWCSLYSQEEICKAQWLPKPGLTHAGASAAAPEPLVGVCNQCIHCWSQITSRCSAGFLSARPFPHFLFGFTKRGRSWGWTPRRHTTGFVETRRKRASSPRTGRSRTEGHLSNTHQSLGHRVPKESPAWVATHLKPMFPCVHGPAATCV